MDGHNHFEDKNGKYFSVYLSESNSYHEGEVVCENCGQHSADVVEYSAEIIEMYDENGVDTGKKSSAYKQAKEHFDADGKTHYMCSSCYYSDLGDFMGDDEYEL
jgi:thymidine kinase